MIVYDDLFLLLFTPFLRVSGKCLR